MCRVQKAAAEYGRHMDEAGTHESAVVMALAGRRIDAADATVPRFPVENAPIVRNRMIDLFRQLRVTFLVCSAACGADLIALDAAGSLGVRRRIILPFDRNTFRNTSVTDRPGDWGELYERITREVEADGELRILDGGPTESPYAITNRAIIDDAITLRQMLQYDAPVTAVLVWDGRSRGGDDFTAQFAELAQERGLAIVEVSTL